MLNAAMERVRFERVERLERSVLEAIGRLRVEAWKERLGPESVEAGQWLDAEDHAAVHFVAWDGERLIGAARLQVMTRLEGPWAVVGSAEPGPFGLLSRRVVLPTYQGAGIGQSLMRERLAFASSVGVRRCLSTFEQQGRTGPSRGLPRH